MFRRQLSALAMLVFVSAGLSSLAGAPAPAAPVPKHLMPKTPPFAHPTAVGTKWVYTIGGREETFVITGTEEKKDGKLVTIALVDANGKQTPYRKHLLTGREWALAEETGQPYDPPWCLAKPPHSEEQKWTFAVTRPDILGAITGEGIQAAGTERLKTPAGEFDAVKVVQTYAIGNGGKTKTTFWYASGVGMLQMDTPQTFVLKAFTPGKD